MGKESIEEIQKQIQEMTEAINGANAAMDQPPSNLYGKFMTDIVEPIGGNPKLQTILGREISRSINRGKMEETLIVFATVGTAYAAVSAATAGIDFVKNRTAKKKAKDMLLACYKELAAKQSLLILEQDKINKRLANEQHSSQMEIQKLKKKLTEISAALIKIAEVAKKYQQG